MDEQKNYLGNLKTGIKEVAKQASGERPGHTMNVFPILGKYLVNVLVSIDQFGNTLAGGSPDETISSRLGRNYKGSLIERGVNLLFFWQHRDHCEKAVEPKDREDDAIFK